MSEYFKGKARVHPWLDVNLIDLMRTHVCSLDINQQDFIAEAIADKLGVPKCKSHVR